MNPLDALELQPFMRNLKEEMPIHTETTAKIKRSYSQGMPKNLMEYSAFVNNKFLNQNLAIIEEMQHRNKSHPIPKWFRQYQLYHYAKYGILKGDHFFGPFAKIFPDLGEHRGIGFLPYAGITLGFGTIGDTKVFGSELTTTIGSGAGSTPFSESTLYIAQFASGISNEFYNQISVSMAGTSGNVRLGVYRSLATLTFSDLVGETGEIAAFNDYAYKNVAEFQIPAGGTVWGAFHQSTNNSINYENGHHRYSASRSYQALPSPIATSDDGTTIIQKMKIRGV